jgi:hypothetical protein
LCVLYQNDVVVYWLFYVEKEKGKDDKKDKKGGDKEKASESDYLYLFDVLFWWKIFAVPQPDLLFVSWLSL